jgi:AcrR family transcriptional regulator
LEVARRLFSEKGIYWTTVEDITESADQGKGTFYKYFESKDAIIRALLEEGLGDLLARTEQAVEDAGSGRTTLSAMIEARVDFFLEHPDYLLFLHQVRGMMQLRVGAAKDLHDVYDEHLRRLAQLIKPSMEGGGSGSAREVATAIAAYTSGLLTYHVLFDGPEGNRRRRKYFLQTLQGSLFPLLKNSDGTR